MEKMSKGQENMKAKQKPFAKAEWMILLKTQK